MICKQNQSVSMAIVIMCQLHGPLYQSLEWYCWENVLITRLIGILDNCEAIPVYDNFGKHTCLDKGIYRNINVINCDNRIQFRHIIDIIHTYYCTLFVWSISTWNNSRNWIKYVCHMYLYGPCVVVLLKWMTIWYFITDNKRDMNEFIRQRQAFTWCLFVSENHVGLLIGLCIICRG